MKPVDRRRFPELCRVPVSVQLGSYRADLLYWGWLGEKWWRNYLHTHSFFEICFVHEGAGTFEIHGAKHKVRRGDLFIARPNEPHEIISDRKKVLHIYFWGFSLAAHPTTTKSPATAAIDALLKAFATSKRFVSRTNSMAVEQTCRLLLGEITHPSAGYTRAIESLSAKLILDVARSVVNGGEIEQLDSSPRDDAKAVVETIRRYLGDNLDRPIGVRDLAAQVQLSQRHVNRIFKAATGQSVGRYLIDLRIAAAEQLLRKGAMPIKQIARAVGYPDTRYFTTLFGRKTGMTPAEFRESGGTRQLRRWR